MLGEVPENIAGFEDFYTRRKEKLRGILAALLATPSFATVQENGV